MAKSMNFEHLQCVKNLVDLCLIYGIKNVVISPGSRSAPMAILFARSEAKIDVVVDERSAAYYALGVALKTKTPVALICTSGTAAYNYAPAVAEAFYQGVPLLILTADRPLHWLNHSEGQQIDQTNLYGNHVSAFLTYDTEEIANNTKEQQQIIDAAFNALEHAPGPVQINVPIPEPLYNLDNLATCEWIRSKSNAMEFSINNQNNELLYAQLNKASKILIVVGQVHNIEAVKAALINTNHLPQVAILSDLLSNTYDNNIISCTDPVLFTSEQETIEKLMPEIVITIGTNLVSKRIKDFLRSAPHLQHWHINEHGVFPDTFKRLNEQIYANPATQIDSWLSKLKPIKSSTYKANWLAQFEIAIAKTETFLSKTKHGELRHSHQISKRFPKNSVVHLGNSLSVRYFEYLEPRSDIKYLSNRGTSGIDGSASTAVGYAQYSSKINTLIIGDTSFMYDINSLWKETLPDNLKIIVFNNGGGGIFKFIKGPANLPESDRLFAANHNYTMKHLASHFSIHYQQIKSDNMLSDALHNLYTHPHISILEIITDKDKNAAILKDYFNYLKS